MRKSTRPAQRFAAHVRRRSAARLRPNMAFWGRQPRTSQQLCFLVRRIMEFHDSERLLAEFSPDQLHMEGRAPRVPDSKPME